MNAFTIRRMEPADLDAVLDLVAASPEAPHWAPADYAPYVTPQQGPFLRAAFVAVQSGCTLGFAAASLLLEPHDAADPENRCELDSMAVHPDARRHGIGSALLEEILSWAAANGSRRFTLEVRASNSSAIRLYERHGLRREGLRPRYYADPTEDAVLLGVPLRS